MTKAVNVNAAEQEWFTTTEAAAYLRTTPKALRMRIARGAIKPDSPGGRGRSREHMFRRSTLDAHYSRKGAA